MIDLSIFQHKKVAFYTLGCKLNFAETSSIGKSLKNIGVEKAGENEIADICIINTCSVTEVADQKGRHAINKLVRENPGAFVVVIGCYAQLKPEQVAAIKGVDLVLGAEQKGQIIEYMSEAMVQRMQNGEGDSHLHEFHQVATKDIKSFAPSCSCGDRTRYFLKVQDGCNYYCTYCTIPIARGNSRNGSIASLVKQAEEVVQEGGKEIVLTGVNIGDFGHSTNENFADLVKALDQVEGIERYRISSIEPNLITNEIVDYCAESKAFMPHFHIPLQSGSNSVLKLMHRRYTTEFFAEKINYIRQKMPDAFFGVDVIVGTRGETDEYFEEAYRFIESLPISQLHVFSYSERPGTQALKIDYVVSPEVKHERSQRLLALSDRKLHDFYERFIGTTRPVLLEKPKVGMPIHGFTDNYIKVEIEPIDENMELINTIVNIELKGFNHNGTALEGVLA
ncbi:MULTISPECIES: tRNA (N(6)-L-threonylcarbamoyladenosine(37)-C(2))-methylthiotransferase MtaB [unclassified Bacteroides]|uniref:tRNA (N(6)-L-threonylcarbamoyladenosine(37)-C(2))- methylthiotransferase MtaB n=1 Tax=unclassified Bacteroides TaxID=2646097 RepID=UPI0004E225B8|nr:MULTISPECIES: tRNA (N(6)-L-threonylcarbamoyladenosine(37)-C(2))-methylthiotransferase MtaB [unclassified Bacteroides]